MLTAKAVDLVIDYERLYLKSRILTDIRPVFDTPRDAIVGSVITHTLRLDYMTYDGDEATTSIALDIKDIRQLAEACQKALGKAKVAEDLMQTTVPTLVSGDDADE